MTAILSPCGLFRYSLARQVAPLPVLLPDEAHALRGKTLAFFGVNPSTADAAVNDATVVKLIGFCKRWGVSRFLLGNAFAYRATDVRELAKVDDPFGDDIGEHVTDLIEAADVLVPMWGDTGKVPPKLRFAFDVLLEKLQDSGKPVLCFGHTKAGDPKHPLMLGYQTQLVPFTVGDDA